MKPGSFWDGGWEHFRLDSAYQAEAYDAASPRQRAALKTAIAFQFALWGESPLTSRHVTSDARGFRFARHDQPAPWTLAVLDPLHIAPARFLAVLMPAVLAGVSPVIVCLDRPSPRMSLALELAGLEDAYVLPPEAMPALLSTFQGKPGGISGRLLLFPAAGSCQPETFAALGREASSLCLPCYVDKPAPRLWTDYTDPERIALLHWAHGDATWVSSIDMVHDAAYLVRPEENSHAGQSFGPGLEACWRHTGCTPGFFRAGQLAAQLDNSLAPLSEYAPELL